MSPKETPQKPKQSMEERHKEMKAILERMSSTMSESKLRMGHDIRISDEEYATLRDYIYKRSGISIPASRKYLLENRLGPLLRELNLKSFSEYIAFLDKGANKSKEEGRLFELVTTNETSFYRNTAQLNALEKTILPELIEQKRKAKDNRLHIWSAGCSSGEEPYTISMILHELLQNELSRWRLSITAQDISEAMLEAARKGVYGKYALRTTEASIINKYFDQEEDLYRVKPAVKRLVRFSSLNMNDAAQMRRGERADIVFCRNVIIYFDEDMKKRVIEAFHERLVPGGYLFIGHSESLHSITNAFEAKYFPGAIVYKKPDGGTS